MAADRVEQIAREHDLVYQDGAVPLSEALAALRQMRREAFKEAAEIAEKMATRAASDGRLEQIAETHGLGRREATSGTGSFSVFIPRQDAMGAMRELLEACCAEVEAQGQGLRSVGQSRCSRRYDSVRYRVGPYPQTGR